MSKDNQAQPSTPEPSSQSESSASQKRTKPRGPVMRFFRWLGLIMLALILCATALFSYYLITAPKITESSLSAENATRIYDKDDNIVWSTATENREYATQDDIPDGLKQAIVSIEDRRFYKHHGVDPIRVGGALASNLAGSSLGMQGGSTLTQQLVKLSVFSTSSADQTLKRKTQEIYLATQVEKNYTKDQILDFYINKVYMGHGIYGMKTAADYYYGKSLKELSTAQLALLAGIPQSPTNYDPYASDTDITTKRRNLVLQAMVKYGALSQDDANQAIAVPVNDGLQDISQKAQDTDDKRKLVDGYVSSTISEAKEMGYDTTQGGLKIHTDMDYKLQKKLYEQANDASALDYGSKDLQLGATMTNPDNGRVIAQIGGRNLKTTFGINRATQTMRSGGSSVKPLVDYGPAVEYLNWPTYRTVEDKKYKYPGTDISVNDWDNNFMGNMTMRSALALSRNIPAIKTLDEVGAKRSSKFLTGLGITTANLPEGSAALGIPISSEQEAGAFGAIANGGTYYKPSYIKDVITSDGTTHKNKVNGKQAMKESTAFMLTDMMKGVISYVGTASEAMIPGLHQAGKSGLVAYDERAGMPDQAISDAWFTGYTRSYVLSVWMGYDQPNQTGHYIPWDKQDLPSKYYKEIMSYAMRYRSNTDWHAPSTVTKTVRNNIAEYEVKGANWSNGGLPSVASMNGTGSFDSDDSSDSSSYSTGSSYSTSSYSTSSYASSQYQRRETEEDQPATTNNGGDAASSSSSASSAPASSSSSQVSSSSSESKKT
ncbi:transglycosylase domain-containing protein [Convivina intestini]|uniref:Penicillin-binding protein 1A n=1 Tax=Convivina intestini TaxID=1505726 RepID=A0A2U1DC90_9LACO|nr:penicillin-binding protein 1A [Convivina intestini]CAH1852474.1 Penicillin-binding protein 1A [Convivina intestini]SDC01138.1 penicillin-binding protein 1A [Leuconostocaceae bacterium R-53105]